MPPFSGIKWATGCPFDCAWCYLKGTLRFGPQKSKPYIKDYVKIEQHAQSFLESANGHKEVLNTGELADSLMWERNGKPFSKFILSLFNGQQRHKVLFLSKSKNIEHLLEGDYRNNAIISFSMNADSVARRFENGAPTVAERIEAASKLSKTGYEVRIRIDPMVPVPDWEDGYKELVDNIFAKFVPSRITLGSLRGLQSTINNASDREWVEYLSEKSNWGRRVDYATRYSIYHELIEYLKAKYDYSNIALCKETLEIWDNLGMDYRNIKCNCVI
jgi:spore photoproduct lyase